MPLQICSLCFGRCENWDSFRGKCLANDGELRRKAAYYTWDSETDEIEVKPAKVCKKEIRLEYTEEPEEIDYIVEAEVVEEEEQEQEEDFIVSEVEEQEEPGDVKPGTSQMSESPTTIYICEECGEGMKGILKYTKHKFQHDMNLQKRIRYSDKIIEKVQQTCGTDALQSEETLLVKSWTQKKRKKLRNSGEAYITNGAQKVEKKQVQPVDCSSCVHKCADNFTERERELLHKYYWEQDYAGKRLFVHENVTERKCVRPQKADSRRKFTLEYYLNDKRVCKKFFTCTLDITDRIVMHCKLKARMNVDVTTDNRGKKGNRYGRYPMGRKSNEVTDETVEIVDVNVTY